jgi:hypothetical protein
VGELIDEIEVVSKSLGFFAAAEDGENGFAAERVEDGAFGFFGEEIVFFPFLVVVVTVGLDFQAETIESGAGGKAIALAEGVEVAEGVAEIAPAFPEIGGGVEDLAGFGGEFEGEDGGEAIRELLVPSGAVDGIGGFEEGADAVGGVLGALPLDEAAGFPFGQILGVDGAAIEILGQDGLYCGKAVEPLGEGLGLLAVV